MKTFKRFPKMLILILFVFNMGVVSAQDVIITKDSNRIEAQIIEITDNEVKYKQLDNLGGPVIVLAASKVASIVFTNGEVFVFKEHAQQPIQINNESNNLQEDEVSSKLVKSIQSSENQIIKSQKILVTFVDTNEALKREGDGTMVGYYFGGQKLKDSEFRNMIEDNCPEAYAVFRKAKRVENIGGLVGTALMAAGGVIEFVGLFNAIKTEFHDEDNMVLKQVGLGLGICLLSIPIMIPTMNASQRLKAQSATIYNQQCNNNKVTSSLSLGLSPNGVGVIVSF